MEQHFTPTTFHTTLGPHKPAIQVHDRDTIVTNTLDARGFDHRRAQRAPRGNPQTGPFYVESAGPGDTLVVYLEEISPNREYGFCGSVVASNLVDPDYARELVDAPLAEWKVDCGAWRAALVGGIPGLGDLVLPLEPILGCFGVAPKGGQSISATTAAEHGGNMDYRGFTAGTTAYFPVFEPGAFFSLGDGHAVQGDGEIVGSGIEISMEVRFTLGVIKGKRIGWPRGENEEWIFTIGSGRPIDQAMQHATTEMLRWLGQDYGLDVHGASLFLAQCVRYDLANMYNPAYTVACKVSKTVLPPAKG